MLEAVLPLLHKYEAAAGAVREIVLVLQLNEAAEALMVLDGAVVLLASV